MFISATCFHVLMVGSYTSTLFLTKGPSWPPTAYNKLFKTPTPERRGGKQNELMLRKSINPHFWGFSKYQQSTKGWEVGIKKIQMQWKSHKYCITLYVHRHQHIHRHEHTLSVYLELESFEKCLHTFPQQLLQPPLGQFVYPNITWFAGAVCGFVEGSIEFIKGANFKLMKYWPTADSLTVQSFVQCNPMLNYT